jgi:sulfhydrogenase subunit beta (sulfur reductase)
MYKIFPKGDLPILTETWQEEAQVYTTVLSGDLTEFQPLSDTNRADVCLTANTRYPPKAFFLPQSETLFRAQGAGLESTEDEVFPRVILGLRACDARAFQLLDDVFIAEEYQDPYWANKRAQTTLVVQGCSHPCETCFCTSVGSGPFDGRGADVMLVDLGSEYFAEVLSEKGQALFGNLPDASQEQIDASRQVQSTARSEIKKPFEADGIAEKLYGLFNSDFWAEVQEPCLGCGVCTFLCPTCHCFDIVDEAQRRERVRNWDTCMFRTYSLEASGHNPRPTNIERTRQRIMHKYAYFVEFYGEIGCTGCGRCVRYCPVGIDIRDIIRDGQAREES